MVGAFGTLRAQANRFIGLGMTSDRAWARGWNAAMIALPVAFPQIAMFLPGTMPGS